MSLRHALLGLLSERTASGYDLLKFFETSLATVWPATQSQIYTELTKLADSGHIAVAAEGPRGRKEYAITGEGLAELRHWLTETKPQRNTRSDILLRVFFLGVLTPEQARGYLAELMEMSEQGVESLSRLSESIDWDDGSLSVYGRIALEYGLRFNAMRREWAEWAAEQIR
ncbi:MULTISPECIES: PadR family transcriptional regulator [unclassified Streptomyces]|uniref:PadR family transcriptional regulator n=1 Tax=unclassified Streptomyces TaxID=2593676 RepID=UPI00225A8560|nr:MULTISPECIES: PadR family transcriptional regulator [unclassified Streptomyces]MCX5048295.1 PadR family transcriptional regulator [Streptomyces sp. NBC_00474]MCX5056971.1 PadR family transcriptional regulator [Streptomyces sp. NBC_00452]MCX5246108.1 PadR family transcriptional regulator [Streptomyces sp. NBC_00201]MCX5288063.1 PadR family transcriptional regulator [Streptomyces sp. NBC_00183]